MGQGRVLYDEGAAVIKPNPLASAQWIWFPEGSSALPPIVGTRYFRRTFQIPADKKIETARMIMTANNSFELKVNGKAAGGTDDHTLWTTDVTRWLKSGENTLTVTAKNGGKPLPRGGLAGSLTIHFADGSDTVLYTDSHWVSSQTEDGAFVAAAQLGAPRRLTVEFG